MKDRPMEGHPTSVPDAAKQVGDVRGRWPWAEPSVWTERMLTTLEKGVKGGKWFRPNAFFAERGLFSLVAAYAAAGQSPRG